MTDFVDDIPRQGRYKYDWETITRDLKDNPGKWAIVSGDNVKGTPGAAQMTARALRTGEIKGTNAGEFDATTRGTTVYARYVGDREDRQ